MASMGFTANDKKLKLPALAVRELPRLGTQSPPRTPTKTPQLPPPKTRPAYSPQLRSQTPTRTPLLTPTKTPAPRSPLTPNTPHNDNSNLRLPDGLRLRERQQIPTPQLPKSRESGLSQPVLPPTPTLTPPPSLPLPPGLRTQSSPPREQFQPQPRTPEPRREWDRQQREFQEPPKPVWRSLLKYSDV